MGATQSNESSPNPEVVRIDRSEVPEEYRTVGVSSDVVKRVNSHNAPNVVVTDTAESERLKAELAREKEEKNRLRNEMARLTELQQRKSYGGSVLVGSPVADDIEERKKIFDDTVERVQQQFFAYHRENVCQQNEDEILSCLKSNQGRVLNCSPLTKAYDKCVGDFRQQVLKGN